MPEGLPAVFECQYNATAIIWRVNGQSVRGNLTHVPGTRLENYNSVVNSLTITAEVEFNESIIECEAVDSSDRRSAILLIQGDCISNSIYYKEYEEAQMPV